MPLVYQAPTTTRENIETPLSRDRKTRFCPATRRLGVERRGVRSGAQHLYVGAADWCSTVQLVPRNSAGATKRRGLVRRGESGEYDPANAKGWLTAFDAENGAVRWKFAAPRPVLAGVTPTAGGLVFAADLGGDAIRVRR